MYSGILDRIETPAYVYDLDEVRRAHAQLRAALPAPSRLFYSLKANPHEAIVRLLYDLGCGAEVSSTGELTAAHTAGVPSAEVLYTGPGKSDREITDAIKAGVELFSVDSPVDLDRVDAAAIQQDARVRCLIRVNDRTPVAGQGLTMTGVASQFGADAEWIEAEPERFGDRRRAAVAGFHVYMGSNLADEEAVGRQLRSATATAARLAAVLRIEPELIDLGGGFPAPFARRGALQTLSSLSEAVADTLDATFPAWREGRPIVAFESGRYLSGTCGRLLTRVVDVKRSHGQDVVVLESGINHLGGMSGLRRLPPLVPDLATPTTEAEGLDEYSGLANAIVAGPLCTPLDTWARNATLPPLAPGDVVQVPNVGAYGLSASLVAFLGHPIPREVIVDGGRITEISQLSLIRTRARPGREQVSDP